MKKHNPMKLIGFVGIRESFLVFSVWGIILGLLGSLTLDLAKNFSKHFSKILEEPISIYTFAILSIIGLSCTCIIRLFCGEEYLRKPLVTKYILAISRTGLTAGAIISGMLFGISIGIALWVITPWTYEANALSSFMFIKLSIFYILFLVPLIILHLYLLFPWHQEAKYLQRASVIYTGIVIILFFTIGDFYHWTHVSFLFLPIVILVSFLKQKTHKYRT